MKKPKPKPNPIARSLRILRPKRIPSGKLYVRPSKGIPVHCIGDCPC